MTSEKSQISAVPFDDALEKTGNGWYNISLAATCALILMGLGADLFGFTLVATTACDLQLTVVEKGVLTSLPFIGILLVSYMWGYISDTKGRRFTLVLSLHIGFVLSCLCSLAPNWIVLALVKFISVCFSCAANSATYTLVGESCSQRVRHKYMLLMTCLLLLSPSAAALLSYPISKMEFAVPISWLGITFSPWRLMCIVLALPMGVGAVAILFFHESPKFLANRGRDEEALLVLKSMHAVNHRFHKTEYEVTSLQKSPPSANTYGFTVKGVWEQSAPLFRPPLVLRTLQLFFIVSVVYMTNNSFLVWLPHIMLLVQSSLQRGNTAGNICELMALEQMRNSSADQGADSLPSCGHVEENTIFTLIASGLIFSFFNCIISYLPNRRRIVLISILCLSALSGISLNLTPEPISSAVMFVMFTSTCLGMGILASYFVDLYPTSYRGMVACLSIMVGRTSSFVGINTIAILLFDNCTVTFYLWSLLVFCSAIVAWFLPPDKPPQQEDQVSKL